MTDAPFPILYEDNHLLAVEKPAGLPTMGVAADRPSVLSQLVERRRNAVRVLATTLGVEASGGRVVPLLQHVPAPQASRLRDSLPPAT